RRIRHLRIESGDPPIESFGDDVLHAQAQLRAETVARHIDEAGDEALEGILAQKQGDPLAFLQMKNAQRNFKKLVVARLKQLVARMSFEDMQERLAVMAVGLEAGAGDDALDLAPQQRRFPRALVVGDRGEEADEQLLAGRIALGVEALDADRVHM